MDKKNWITYPERANSVSFKRVYKLKKAVKSVSIFITSMGWYNLYINEKRIDKDVFTPGFTDFNHRVQFQKYNITRFIKDHINLNVDVGEGWGGGNRFAWGSAFIYFPMSINYEIHLTYVDDTKEVLVSDETLDVTTNTIVDSTIYHGESQDYRLEPHYLGKAKYIEINSEIVPQEGEHIVFGERFSAKKMWKAPNGDLLIDFGQNIAGMVEINIKGKAGDIIKYKPAEVLDKDGNFYDENYRSASSTYSFVLSGKKEILRPKFSFLGGRYIKLIEYPSYVKKENFTLVAVHSEMDKTCSFKCGNKKIQRLYLNSVYGQLSNYLDIPTDCPQRNERLGWTGDAQVFCSTGAIHYNVQKFFRKWIHDMILCQYEDGGVDEIIPIIAKNHRRISSAWGDACAIVPYEIYRAYNDKKLLIESLPMIEKWVRFLLSNTSSSFIPHNVDPNGDWLATDRYLAPDAIIQRHEAELCPGSTNFDLISTAYLACDIQIIIEAYKLLKKDYSQYVDLLNNVKKAYQKEFIKDGHMIGPKALIYSKVGQTCYTQTGIILSLYFDLCKEEDKKSLVNDLVELIKECGNKMTTGFVGTPYILHTLTKYGHSDIAYNLLFQEEFPSWLYSVNKGATTMWEHYDSIKEDGSFWSPSMNSFNHYAYGAVFGWMFNSCVGINMLKPAYKEILIKPIVDKRLGFVDCSFKCKYGVIKVNWKYNNGNVKYEIVVPKGIKASIDLGDNRVIKFPSGGTLRKTIKYDSK